MSSAVVEKKSFIVKHKIGLVFLLIALVILLIPTVYRVLFFDSLLITEQPYLHMHIVKTGMGEVTAYHVLLDLLSGFVSLSVLSIVLPLLLGLATLFFFYLILRTYVTQERILFLILLVLVLSPAYIYTFTVSSPHALALFLIVCGLWVFIQQKPYDLFSIIFFSFAAMSMFNALIIILLLGTYFLLERAKGKLILFTSLVLILLVLSFNTPFFITYMQSQDALFLSRIVADFGGIGFGIFSILLFFIGIGMYARPLKFLLYPLSIFFLFTLFLTTETVMYLQLFLALFAGLGFYRVCASRWVIREMRYVVLIILFCGVLFSALSFMNRLSTHEPTPAFMKSLDWLSTQKSGLVLSHETRTYYLRERTGFPVFFDALSTQPSDMDASAIFQSRNLPFVEGQFTAHNITYLFIDKKMKEGLVWEREDQGLLFLLRNKDVFELVFDNTAVQIYQFKRKSS